MPIVSVVVPLYNKRAYISRALDSVLFQTIKDFEVIVVNDASSDGGERIVEKYTDKRIRLIHRQRPGVGGHAARNEGISNALAPIISFLDADDQYSPNFLSVILKLAKKYRNAGAYCTSFEVISPSLKRSTRCISALRNSHLEDTLLRNYFKEALSGPVIWSSAVAIPRSTFESVGVFPEGVPLGGDLDMWMRIGAKFPVAISKYSGAVYHQEAKNRIDTGEIKGLEYELVRTGEKLMASGHVAPEYLKYFREYVCMYRIGTARQLVFLGQQDRAKEMLLKCKTNLFILPKLWWLFWAIMPSELTRQARNIKRMLRGLLGRVK